VHDHTYQIGALRKPLNATQNAELVRRLNNGEDVMEEIILGNYRLLISIAKKYVGDNDIEDLIQEAVLVTMKAAREFDPRKGVFSTFLYACVRNQLVAIIVPRIRMNLIEKMGGGDDWERTVHTKDPYRLEHIEMADHVVQLLKEEIDVLVPDRTEKLVFMLFHGLTDGKHYSQQEIAAIVGLSRLYVRDILERTTREVRLAYGEEDEETMRREGKGAGRQNLFSPAGGAMLRCQSALLECDIRQTPA